MFLPNFTSLLCYSESFIEGEVEKPYSLSYRRVPMEISQKIGICLDSRPVSRDRRILVMEMEVGKCKTVNVAYLLLIF